MGKRTIQSVRKKIEPAVHQRLQPFLERSGFSGLPLKILMAAFKEERHLEIYGEHQGEWKGLKVYDFTGFSGSLGPKLKEGDRQIPEGIYQVEYLNPNSSYYLSVKINYPNAFDRLKGFQDGRPDLGSDIFIHGKKETVGCIPIGDEAIEEVFALTSHAIDQGIRVIISPRDFRVKPGFPVIGGVSWLAELYGMIKTELDTIPGFSQD